MLTLLSSLVLVACDPPSQTSVTLIPVGATRELVFNVPIPDLRFEVTCPAVAGATCNAQVGRVEVFHASNPAKVIAAATNGPAINALSGMVTQPVPGSVFSYLGSTLTVRANFVCGNGLAVSSTVNATSQPTVIPPRLSVLQAGTAVISWVPMNGLDLPNYVGATEVPANLRFTPAPSLHVVPRGTETATVRVTGPGLDFTKAYVGDGGTDSFSASYTGDPAAKLQVTGPGTGQMWVEYAGISSEKLALTFVGSAAGGGSAGGGGSSGGGAAGGAGTDPEPKGGCGCAAGVDGAFALAVLLLVRVRARRG